MSANKVVVAFTTFFAALFLLTFASACSNEGDEKTTPTLTPTLTSEPEGTLVPTETPAPTAASTSTPKPTQPPTPKPTPKPSPTVSIVGKEVFTTEDDVRVRAGPSTNQTILATYSRNVCGLVTDGSVVADGYTWWEINYEDGTTGWSAQDWLKAGEKWPAITECDFSKPVDLRPTTDYGISGTDAFDTLVCGYVKLSEEKRWEQMTIAYLAIVDYADEGFISSVDEGIRIGNSVNRKGPRFYEFSLGCFSDGKIQGDGVEEDLPYLDAATEQAILSSSPENLVSLVLSFGYHGGRGCSCCNLAHQVRSY